MNELLTVLPLPVLAIIAILIVVSLLMIAYAYFKNKGLNDIRGDVYRLFLRAEHIIKESKAGQQKMKWVMSKARLLLPKWLQVTISDNAFEKIVQLWFEQIKDLLDDGKLNQSHSRGGK